MCFFIFIDFFILYNAYHKWSVYMLGKHYATLLYKYIFNQQSVYNLSQPCPLNVYIHPSVTSQNQIK